VYTPDTGVYHCSKRTTCGREKDQYAGEHDQKNFEIPSTRPTKFGFGDCSIKWNARHADVEHRATTSVNTMSRPRRSAAVASNASPSVTVSRSPSNSPEDRRKSIRLTVKLPSSKLREVMSEREVARLKDSLTPGVDKVLVPTDRLRSRSSTTKKYAEFGESDEEEDDDEEEEDEEEEDQEEEEGDEDEPMNDFDEIGAEPEETDEDDEDGENDEDVEMEEQTLPPPKIKLKTTPQAHGRASKPILVVTPATGGPARSVDQKEMELDPGDEEEELSELADDDDQDETNMNDEDDEELDDEEEGGEGEEDGMEEDDLGESDDELASGSATPDLSKLTSRQRGSAEGGFMALPMEPQVCLIACQNLT
jgi:Ino eighty subunit 2